MQSWPHRGYASSFPDALRLAVSRATTLWRLGAIAGLGLCAMGCKVDPVGLLSCGDNLCNDHQHCVQTQGGAECQCLPGYSGSSCYDCPSGYRLNAERECQQIETYCSVDCGSQGNCEPDEHGGSCQCRPGYAGPSCEACSSDFQDNDRDGTCLPGCARAALSCEAPKRCSDASGHAECQCPVGSVGDACAQCALGYHDHAGQCVLSCVAAGLQCGQREICDDSGDTPRCICQEGYSDFQCSSCAEGFDEEPITGLCLPTCDAGGLDCGTNGECRHSARLAYCDCSPGYAGPQCERCAEGFAPGDGGECRSSVSQTHSLLVAARYAGTESLVALDPRTGEGVLYSDRWLGGIAFGESLLYSSGGVSISAVDPSTMQPDLLATAPGLFPALAFDPTRNLLYAIGKSAGAPLLTIDPVNGSMVVIADTGLQGVRDLSYDIGGDRLLALTEALVSVDLQSANTSVIAELPPSTWGLSFDRDGTLYAASGSNLSAEEAQLEACRLTAEQLGGEEFADAGAELQGAEPNTDVVLQTNSDTAPELLAYLSGTESTSRTITIASQNPAAFLCLDLREPTTILIPAAARFSDLVVFSRGSPISVEMEVGYEPTESAPAIHLRAAVDGTAITVADTPAAHIYSSTEWAALRLPVDPSYYVPGPGVLHQLGSSGSVVASTLLTGGIVPMGTMTTIPVN